MTRYHISLLNCRVCQADPTGDYIRHFVPELSEVRGDGTCLGINAVDFTHQQADVHRPPVKLADKLGYPRPLVDHSQARERAIQRYKVPGQE